MSIVVWGPFWESYDPTGDQYYSGRMPDPSPIWQSQTPTLKTSVSVLLNEIIKPSRLVQTSSIPNLNHDSKPNESVIRAAIAMMDPEVVRKVKAANDRVEAIAILTLYDPRFGDLPNSLQVYVLSYIRAAFDRESIEAVALKTSPQSNPKRARRPSRLQIIVQRHIRTAVDFNDPQKVKVLFAALDEAKEPLLRRGYGVQRTGKWSSTTTALRKQLIKNLKRYFYRWQIH